MGLFDKIKKGLKSAMAYAEMDDFLIKTIDKILCEKWQKVSERTPVNIGGVSLEEEAEYNFLYQYQGKTIQVEMEHEFPLVEIEMQSGVTRYETKIQVSDFVVKDGTDFSIKNETDLRNIVAEMASMVE